MVSTMALNQQEVAMQQTFDFTPRHNAVWSNLRTGFRNTCTWAMENPAELLIAVMAVILMDIDESLDNIEEATDA